MDRMQRLSRALRRFASFVFFLLVACLVFSPGLLLDGDVVLKIANDVLRQFFEVEGLHFGPAQGGWQLKAFVFLPLVTSGVTAIFSLGALIRLLHQFEAGAAFSMESVRLVRFLGWIQVAMAPVMLLVLWGMAALVKVLTTQVVHPWANQTGSVIDSLFFGGVVLLVAYVREEGCRLKSEQELVI